MFWNRCNVFQWKENQCKGTCIVRFIYSRTLIDTVVGNCKLLNELHWVTLLIYVEAFGCYYERTDQIVENNPSRLTILSLLNLISLSVYPCYEGRPSVFIGAFVLDSFESHL